MTKYVQNGYVDKNKETNLNSAPLDLDWQLFKMKIYLKHFALPFILGLLFPL